MRTHVHKTLATGLVLLILVASGCTTTKHEGPVESTGRKLDNAVDNMKEGQSPFHKKGAAEKAGEAVDEALGTDNNR